MNNEQTKKQHNCLIPLPKISVNSRGTIRTISGSKSFLSKVTGLGITPGSKIAIIRNHKVGPLIIFMRDSFIAVSRKEAANIFVEI